MMDEKRVKIRLLVRKSGYGVVYKEGSCVDAVLHSNGHAQLLRHKFITAKPDEFVIIIPDEVFEKLLGN